MISIRLKTIKKSIVRKKLIFKTLILFAAAIISTQPLYAQKATNPILYADVPDLSMIRVGNVYYMSSTTMHMSPGVPIMKSTDVCQSGTL